MANLELRMLGPPRVELNGEPVELQRRKALALLIYVAITGQPQSRDTLATLFWPDHDQSRARAYLRRDLAVLNNSLAGDWLLIERDIVELKCGPDIWIDVNHFHKLLSASQQHGHPPVEVCPNCLSSLSQAVELYTDDFLAGFTLRNCHEFDDWQFFQTESLRQELAAVLERLVQGYGAQGTYDAAIPYARRWVALDPLHGAAQRWLMQLYDRSGQPSAALRQYEEYVDLLEAELGLPPEEEIKTLYEAIKAKRILAPFMKIEAPVRAEKAQPPAEPPAEPAPPAPDPLVVVPAALLDGRASDPIPFVGRDNEYGQLLTTLTRACSGRGQIVLLEGEPGIGKSRLAREALCYAQTQGVSAVWQKCYQSEQTMPYQVLIDLIGQLLAGWPAQTFRDVPPSALAELAQLTPELTTIFPKLPPLPAGLAEAHQARLFRALYQFLIAPAAAAPLILVIDDIQWADHVTLQFLNHLIHYIVDQPVLLICTYRTEEVATDEQLTNAVQALQREAHALHLRLTRLSPQHAYALVEALSVAPNVAALGRWLHQETDGNPFFLMTILQSLQEQGVLKGSSDAGWQIDLQPLQRAGTQLTLPDALRQSVLARLRRVSPPARQVLDVAAVYGRRFDFTTLQAITGENSMTLVDIVEDLMMRQLVREEKEGHYDFNHDKIREVAYQDLSQMRCMLLHRQVAESIETTDSDRAGTLAEHFEKGEVWAKAITYLGQAAGRSRQLFAMEEALDFYDRAIILAERQPKIASQKLLLDLHEQRGETRGLMGGHVEEAVADLLLVLDAARDIGDQERERVVLIRIGQVYRYGDRYNDALYYLKAALAVARQSGDDRSVADALYHLGSTVWSQGKNDEALAYHQEAVEICRRLDLSDLVAVQAFHGLGEAYFLAGRAAEAIDLYETSLVFTRQIRDKSYESENLGNMGMAMMVYGIADYDRAKEAFTRSLKISQSASLEWHAAQVLGPLGLACGLSGDYHQALEYLNGSLPIAESIGAKRFQSLLLDMYGTIWQELNLLDRAKAAHQQAVKLAKEADADWWLPRIQANLAIDRLRLGDLDVAEPLQAAFEDAMSRRLEMHAVRCLEGQAELALKQGQPEQALEYAEQLQRLAEPGGMRETVAQAQRWRGEAYLALDDPAQAAAALEQALALAETIGRPRLAWDLHTALAALPQTQAEPDRAASHIARARQIAEALVDNLNDPALQSELRISFALGVGEASPVATPQDNPPPEVEPPPVEAVVQPAQDQPVLSAAGGAKRFVRERLISSGGMGEVYLGRDTETGRRVAIKRLRPEWSAQNQEAVKRFIREGEILRQLDHPNIVKVLATAESEHQPVIVMEFVAGGSLQDLLQKEPKLPLERVLKIGLELADALARTHYLNIIHRDIKPANVLLTEEGTPRLTDFGVAYLAQQETRLTQEGNILGTTIYMSPEAWRGEELDARSDIWSFGAVLYEMLAGQPPFAARQIAAIITAILNDPLPDLLQYRADTPPALASLLTHMLTKDRHHRLDSMRQVAAGLEIVLRGLAAAN